MVHRVVITKRRYNGYFGYVAHVCIEKLCMLKDGLRVQRTEFIAKEMIRGVLFRALPLRIYLVYYWARFNRTRT